MLSAGDGQDNGNEAEQGALDQDLEARQDDQVYEELHPDRMGNGGRGGNYMHLGGGKIKYIMDSYNPDVLI